MTIAALLTLAVNILVTLLQNEAVQQWIAGAVVTGIGALIARSKLRNDQLARAGEVLDLVRKLGPDVAKAVEQSMPDATHAQKKLQAIGNLLGQIPEKLITDAGLDKDKLAAAALVSVEKGVSLLPPTNPAKVLTDAAGKVIGAERKNGRKWFAPPAQGEMPF